MPEALLSVMGTNTKERILASRVSWSRVGRNI